MDDQQRARDQFEEWCKGRYNLTTRQDSLGNGVYVDRWVQGAWVGFRAALRAAPEVGDSYVVLQRVDVKRLLAGDENSPGHELSRRRIAACLDLHNQNGVAVVPNCLEVVPTPALGAHEVHPEAIDAGLNLGKSGERLVAADALEHAASVSMECDGSATAPEGLVLVPVEPTREMMDAGRAAVMAEHCAGPKWTPRQHYEASGRPTTGIPEDVLDERGPLTKESTAVMVYGTMLAHRPHVTLPQADLERINEVAARPQGVKDGR